MFFVLIRLLHSCKFFQVSALEIVQDARLVDGMDQVREVGMFALDAADIVGFV